MTNLIGWWVSTEALTPEEVKRAKPVLAKALNENKHTVRMGKLIFRYADGVTGALESSLDLRDFEDDSASLDWRDARPVHQEVQPFVEAAKEWLRLLDAIQEDPNKVSPENMSAAFSRFREEASKI